MVSGLLASGCPRHRPEVTRNGGCRTHTRTTSPRLPARGCTGLRLLADSARNGAVAALAREGGLASTLWAGSPGAGRSLRAGRPLVQGGAERRLLLGFAGDDFGYAMDLGPPQPARTMFGSDPEIKV